MERSLISLRFRLPETRIGDGVTPPPPSEARTPLYVSSGDFSAEEMLLLEDGHCLREHALDACRLRAAPPLEAFQATSLYTLVEMVANGLGVTFLPEIALSAGLAKRSGVALKPLAKDAPARRIALIW